MEEIQFKRPEIEDRELIESYFRKYPSRSCERTFVNVFLWSRHYKVTFAEIEHTIVFKSEDHGLAFAYPVGAAEDVKRVLEFLMEYSAKKRSEERRVGKECRIGCRSRWSPYH